MKDCWAGWCLEGAQALIEDFCRKFIFGTPSCICLLIFLCIGTRLLYARGKYELANHRRYFETGSSNLLREFNVFELVILSVNRQKNGCMRPGEPRCCHKFMNAGSWWSYCLNVGLFGVRREYLVCYTWKAELSWENIFYFHKLVEMRGRLVFSRNYFQLL